MSRNVEEPFTVTDKGVSFQLGSNLLTNKIQNIFSPTTR